MYSTQSDLTIKKTQKDVNLVEQILEQGQRLRNSMVKAILDNDPTNNKFLQKSEQIDDLEIRTICSSDDRSEVTLEEKHKFLAYLRGEQMTRNEEKKVLETFRAMSNIDLIDITDRSLHSDYSCNCDTCREYYNHHQSLPQKSSKVPLLNLKDEVKFKQKSNKLNYLKYIDSLKIRVHSVYLNQEGIRKVYGNSYNKNKCYNYPLSLNHTYFLEYKIPSLISKATKAKISKVDSGLDSGNFVRMCSRKVQDETIIFKQISLHEIQHIENVNLQTLEIKFQISSRTHRQKSINVLGTATFNLNLLLENENFTANNDLLIFQNEAPIVIGKLKIGLEFGCGQSYFGENFLRTLDPLKERNLGDDMNHVNTEIFSDDDEVLPETNRFEVEKAPIKENETFGVGNKTVQILHENVTDIKEIDSRVVVDVKEVEEKKMTQNVNIGNISMINSNSYYNQVLFGFFFVGEACFEEIRSTYVTCNPFCQNDTLYSRVIPESKTPLYNFQQSLPFLIDESFLNTLRSNFMIFEFWIKSETNKNIGIANINLHQFYVSYRNPIITKYLERNKLPVIGCDWWESIYDPLNGDVFGEAQILVALGTEDQILNLKKERGFINDTIRVKTTRNFKNDNENNKVLPGVNKKVNKNRNTLRINKKPNPIKSKSKDIGIQSDIVINEITKMDSSKLEDNNDKVEVKESENYTAIASFLQTLMTMNNKTFKENCTNTEAATSSLKASPNITQDSPLKLTEKSLTETLGLNAIKEKSTTFKAHIFIENALHLPFRKKSKTKKSRGKSGKYEEILPSCYVTFETVNGDIKMTNVVQKSKNPVWNYNSDVELPKELLTNVSNRINTFRIPLFFGFITSKFLKFCLNEKVILIFISKIFSSHFRFTGLDKKLLF
nr:uncharacterized protein LOC111418148 [Onthophagus taurus]